VQDDGVIDRSEVLGESGAPQRGWGVLGVLFGSDLEGDDLAAEQVEDEVKLEKEAGDMGGKLGDVPGPDLVGGVGPVGGPGLAGTRRAGPSPVVLLAFAAQDPGKGRLGGEVDPQVGPLDDNRGGWLGSVFGPIALAQHLGAFLLAESVAGNRADGSGAPVRLFLVVQPPALKRALAEPQHFSAAGLAGSFGHGGIDV
jgi:hypothetical protein